MKVSCKEDWIVGISANGIVKWAEELLVIGFEFVAKEQMFR